jgi:hypothetical protein
MKVYLSFDPWDKELANRIAQKLAEHKHEVFLVQRKPFMSPEDARMVKSLIEKSDLVVPLITKSPTKQYDIEKTAENLTQQILRKLTEIGKQNR